MESVELRADMRPLMVSKKVAATMLGLSEREVIRLLNEGELERRWIGDGSRYYRIPFESLEAYVAALPESPVQKGART